VSPVKYELGFYIADDVILHSNSSENLRPYIAKNLFLKYDTDQRVMMTDANKTSAVKRRRVMVAIEIDRIQEGK
jgi:hypothetical protein